MTIKQIHDGLVSYPIGSVVIRKHDGRAMTVVEHGVATHNNGRMKLCVYVKINPDSMAMPYLLEEITHD